MGKKQRLRVGVAQVDTRKGRLQANLDKHLEYIAEARGRGVDLLVFPEMSLSGFLDKDVHEESLGRDSPEVAQIAAACEGIHAVIGLVEEAPAAQFYNTSFVLFGGSVVHVHRKLNLATYGSLEEGKHFAQGRFVDGFNIAPPSWRAGVLICADVWNPALVHLAALHGVTLLVVPTNSARDAVSSEFSNPVGWTRATQFYAMIYGMPFVMANRVGQEAGLSFWGGSRIVDPFGHVLVQAGEDEEALIDAELDYEVVRRARIQLPTVRDSNLALVHREITRLQQLIGVPVDIRQG